MSVERTSQHRFFGSSALLFIGSAILTIILCRSMSALGDMPMPGGWTMSMAWMPMPGQTWLGALASFVGMWTVMMIAMMLPSFVPSLLRYRQGMGSIRDKRLNWLTALVALGYFFVWTMWGAIVFPLGALLVQVEMHNPVLARIVPIAAGIVIVIAGAMQFSRWKAHHLTYCRESANASTFRANPVTAWRHGLRLGLHCACGCAGFTAILLVIGVMDLRVMALMTLAITAERIASDGQHIAKTTGMFVVGIGLLSIARAAGPG